MICKEDVIVTLAVAALVVFVPVLVCILSATACSSTAEQMKMRSTFGITTGCMIEHKPGEWIPLKNFRVI